MGELTRVESWWWGRGCDVGESLIEVLGLKGQVLGNKNCSLSGPSSLLPSSPFLPPSLPSFISSLFPLFSFLSLANINWLLSYGKIRFWHTKVNCFLPEKFPFLSRLPGGWTHGRKKKGLPWLRLGTRKLESGSAHKDQSQRGLGALNSEQMAKRIVHQRPWVLLLVRGVSFQNVPINTFSWHWPYGCWDE